MRGGERPGFGGLGGIGGPQHDQARNRAQAGHLFDRLVGGAILADADAVVGEDVNDPQLAERSQADGRLHVVAEKP